MEENTFINVSKDMMSFIEKSPTAFQVTANFMDLLDDAGFVRLNERDRWHLIPGGKYYVTRNDSSIIAFRMPAAEGFINYQIAAAHSDSPSFKVKENPELTPDKNYVSLNVEKYGGTLIAPRVCAAASFSCRKGNSKGRCSIKASPCKCRQGFMHNS